MLRIGICDDDSKARDSLRFQLEKILDEREGEVVYEFTQGKVAASWISHHPGEIDLLFLDVEMPEFSGMDTARQIRRTDEELMIVFVTGYSDYVFDGYQVGAMDYLMKPVDQNRLLNLVERAEDKIKNQERQMFTFHNTEGLFRLPIEKILYFYSDRRKVSLVLGEREYSFYGRLDEIEESLEGRFVRIHQRYLVNPRQTEHIGGREVTVCGQKLPISRGLKEEATRKLAKAMVGGGWPW